jgi:Glycosyl hydrolases family 2, sugar binding domain/Glycosyl hydrolases family 2/Glycosyl hydrolases family 2, TIM barrel domain
MLAALAPAMAVRAADASGKPADWHIAQAPLMTRWAKEVSPRNAHPEYPRPQMVREKWQNLNGLWQYAIATKDAQQPTNWDGQILVPFPVESALSGVMKRVYETNRLWYRRTFSIPRDWKSRRVLLHFGAVDWETTVWVNGKELGSHRGGYDEFSFDITDALKPSGEQEIIVAVFDPTDAGYQPRGKQVRRPNGIWYTPTSGIWQTVWLEPISNVRIESLHLTPDFDKARIKVSALIGVQDVAALQSLFGSEEAITIHAQVYDGTKKVSEYEWEGSLLSKVRGAAFTMNIPQPKPWSPESPHLYTVKFTLALEGKRVDEASSYFGMRKISVAKDTDGILRLCLNNKPLFQYGPLDQGFWPDGLYTAPTDEALRYDIEMTKKLGFNMARKHVKVEPDRWYYCCDKLGLLVWQDMPSGDFGNNRTDERSSDEAAINYENELRRMIEGRWNHPSIVMWVPFNEGWGQHDTPSIVDWIRALDPSRPVNNASGWTDRKVGDVVDMHKYPGPGVPNLEENRAAVLGEFGGLGLPVKGHTWQNERNWGYRSFTNAADLTAAYVGLLDKMHPMTGADGLAAAVYTQTTDVEVEVNGLMTYDRALVKMDQATITAAAQKLFTTPPKAPAKKTIVPTSETEGFIWRFTTTKPDDGWFKSGFDDSAWKQGPGGFGTRGTPGAHVRTEWNTSDIWLRRRCDVALPAAGELHLLLHHDEDAEVYLNGVLAAKVSGYTTDYEDAPISAEAQAAIKLEGNVLAVHCHQTGGGQYIDVGLVTVVPAN